MIATWVSRRASGGVLACLLVALGLASAATPAGADAQIGSCTIVSSPTPTHHTVCPDADLSGANLDGLDLSYADLDHTNLEASSLQGGANLTGANLEYADLTDATIDADFHDTDARHATFTFAVVREGCLCGDFTDAAMSSMQIGLYGPTTVSGAFDGADLSSTDLGSSDVSGSFVGSSLRGDVLEGGDIGGALHDADMTGSDLRGTNFWTGSTAFENVDLTNADLSSAYWIGPFVNTTITGSTWDSSWVMPLTTYDVAATNASGAVVDWDPGPPNTGLSLGCDHVSGAVYPIGKTTVTCTITEPDTNTTGKPTSFTIVVTADFDVVVDGCTIVGGPTVGHHTSCEGADLSNANLGSFDLSYSDLQGADLSGAELGDATLTSASLDDANLTGADLDGARVENTSFVGADLTGVDLSTTTGTNAHFEHTILAVSNRTYPADGPSGRVTSWRQPAGLAGAGIVLTSCTPHPKSTFPVGTTFVVCQLARTDAAHSPIGAFSFTESILPVVEPGTGEVAAPASGTADLAVTVSLNAPAPAGGVTVPWTTLHVGGSATIYGIPQASTSDFTASSGTVTFVAGQTTATVDIPVTGDSVAGPEFVLVSFHDPTNAYVGGFWGLAFGFIDPSP